MKLIHGDCLDEMKLMPDCSVDFIVTDSPYGISFMSKAWDQQIPSIEYWREMLRICKPGSMMACAGLPRMYHRLACVVEDAGWQIRDCILHLFGSGFPKSHNNFGLEGYGTALKPAYEPWILAMKPLDGTYAQNAAKWGVAGLNIDDCRIKHNEQCKLMKKQDSINSMIQQSGRYKDVLELKPNGRWPANLILDEQAVEQLDLFTGILKSGTLKPQNKKTSKGIYEHGRKVSNVNEFQGDSGGASRFFYCAKASTRERGEGNSHPTVKPLVLMKYIVTLLAPPGNPICLDPFMGSGTTGIACRDLGIGFIGIEKEKEYYDIAVKRIGNEEPKPDDRR